MIRNIELSEISDGSLYTSTDMAKADCRGCEGCFACCRGMGRSIVLDPWDIAQMTEGTERTFAELMEGAIELNVVDGMILPNLRMDEKIEKCTFLDQEGRCSIHRFRPGICRMFPLGRYYEENGFRYFLQIHECQKKDRSKVKIKKWLDIANLKAYEAYIWDWHQFLALCRRESAQLEEEQIKILQTYLLRTFYQTPYGSEDFYKTFYERMAAVKETLGLC